MQQSRPDLDSDFDGQRGNLFISNLNACFSVCIINRRNTTASRTIGSILWQSGDDRSMGCEWMWIKKGYSPHKQSVYNNMV
jgi:hypothetical protein